MDYDENVLGQLKKAGSDLSLEHGIDFYSAYGTERDAECAARRMQEAGFHPVVRIAEPGKWRVEFNYRMAPTLQGIKIVRTRLEAIAVECHGSFDGWGAGVQAPPATGRLAAPVFARLFKR